VNPNDESEVGPELESDVAFLLHWEHPPAEVHNALIALFDRGPNTLADALSYEFAELLFDSRRDLVTPSIRRSVAAEVGYRLAFTNDHADVVLHITSSGHECITIHGQVMAHDPIASPYLVRAADDRSEAVAARSVDEYGRFVLTNVSTSVRSLRLTNETTRFRVQLPEDTDDL
jgi:hypothetical protein